MTNKKKKVSDEMFEDLSGKKTTKERAAPPTKSTAAKTDIHLSIPHDDGWIDRDLSEATGAEFVKWAKQVYPYDLSKYAKDFDSYAKRVNQFKNIVQYHISSPFQRGKDGRGSKDIWH